MKKGKNLMNIFKLKRGNKKFSLKLEERSSKRNRRYPNVNIHAISGQ